MGPGAYIAATAKGAYILSHDGEFALTGRSVHQLLERLAPALDGRFSIEELTEPLSPERREMVQKLITSLTERSLVRDADHEVAPRSELQTAFLGYFRGSAAAAFAEYRDLATVVLGDGALCAAVAHAARRSGLRDVRVVDAAEPGIDLGQAAVLGPVLDGAQLVLHATDNAATDKAAIGRARLLDTLCARRGIRLVQALVVGGHAWMTTDPADRWIAGWRRADPWRGTLTEPAPTAVAATAVANQLVHGAFRALTEVTRTDRSTMVRVDMATLRSDVAAFLPHPYATTPASRPGLADRIAQLRSGQRLTDEEFSRRAARCAGDILGAIGDPTEREFAQLPLHVTAIEVADPVGLLDPRRPATPVTGAGLDFTTARLNAARKALSAYAALMVDPRRLVGSEGGDPDALLAALRRGTLNGHVAGYGVVDGRCHLVDVRRVFPALCSPDPAPVPAPGVATGYDWDEAVASGLVGQCRHLTLRWMEAASTTFPLVDVSGAALDSRGDSYRTLLTATGRQVSVHDVTGPLGVPTMVGYLESTASACGSAMTWANALTETLEQLLLRHQAESNRQDAYVPAPTPAIPPHRRGSAALPATRVGDLDIATVASRLDALGHHPVAVPLDHDSEVNALIPYTVHVVLVDQL